MTASARIQVEDVRDELRIEDVAEHYCLCRYTGRATTRLPRCPNCKAESSSNAIVINFLKQTWGHFGQGKREGGECYGDALSLIGACEGLDPERREDFAKIVEIAATIANVPARELTPEEREQRRVARERRNAEREAELLRDEERRLRDAGIKAHFDWSTKIRGRRNRAGMTYLRQRGLDASYLVEGDYVRFDGYGNPSVQLWGFDGELVNVVRRRRDEGEPKCCGLEGCPTTGSLSGRLQEITAGTNTIITEGVIDTLTAITKWPGRLVLGAHGAGQLSSLVAAAAPRVKETGGKLVLIPDSDDIGKRQMIRAGERALEAGLVMDQTLLVIELAPHHDLNEAHCNGWKP